MDKKIAAKKDFKMNSLDLEGAAKFLGLHPDTLQSRAKSGDIPGAKIGKEWRFLELDLVAYFRSHYKKDEPESTKCHSTKEAKRGGTTLSTKASGLENLLGLPIRSKRNACTTKQKQHYGSNAVQMNEHSAM